LQDISVEIAPWWIETLNRFENVYIPRVAALPPETYAKNEILLSHNIQSLVVVPMVYGGVLVGFMGCDSVQTERIWSEEEIKFFKIMGEIIINALERQRAEQKILQRNEELATFNRVAIAITSTPDPHDRFRKVTREIIEIFNARHSGIALVTSDRQALTVMADYSRGTEPSVEGHVVPLANNLSFAKVIETGRPLVVPDVQTSPLTEAIHDLMQKMSIQCIMIVPIISRGEVVGTLGIDFDVANRQFTPDEVRLADTIAGQISGAIENAQLLEQTQAALIERQRAEADLLKALERTESLYRISNTVATATDPQTMFETVLGEYLRLLNLKWGGVSMLNRADESRIRIMYIDGQPVQTNIDSPATTDLLFQHLIINPKPLIIGDVYTHPLTKDNQMRNELQARSILFLPIVLRGQVIGIISVGSTQKEYIFSPGDIETGQAVTGQLAVWLENRQLLAQAQYRSDRLQTAAEVSRAASSILDVGELINTSVNYIHDQFTFYYVGLFLIDEAGQWAVLRAGTGEAGRIQLERNHQLEIGGESMIGWSVANRQARIALDVGEEAVHFKNPILPDTHSEMALPLISRDEVIGAITVQSIERGAFSDEDITLLQTMADQLANAIVNARLFENADQAQKEAEARLQETVALQQLSQNLAGTLEANDILDAFFDACTKEIGFEYVQFSLVDKYQNRVKAIAGVGVSETNIQRANHSLNSKDIMIDIVKTGQTEIITGWDDRFDKENFEAEGHADWVRIFTPITLRQENIGLVEAGFNKNVQATIQDAQLRLLRAFINQTALALDNAQRYEASQRAARREALIKEIATKVRASTDLDTILQTTVKEVGQAITSKRAYIHLVSGQKPASPSGGNGKPTSGVPAERSGKEGQGK
jgi:GAF domain-containing protein